MLEVWWGQHLEQQQEFHEMFFAAILSQQVPCFLEIQYYLNRNIAPESAGIVAELLAEVEVRFDNNNFVLLLF